MSLTPGGATNLLAFVGLPTMIASIGACATFAASASAPAAADHSADVSALDSPAPAAAAK